MKIWLHMKASTGFPLAAQNHSPVAYHSVVGAKQYSAVASGTVCRVTVLSPQSAQKLGSTRAWQSRKGMPQKDCNCFKKEKYLEIELV